MDRYLAALPFASKAFKTFSAAQIGEKGSYQVPQFIQPGWDRVDFGRIAILSQNSYIAEQKACL